MIGGVEPVPHAGPVFPLFREFIGEKICAIIK